MLAVAAATWAAALWSCTVNSAEPGAKPTPESEATSEAGATPEAERVSAARRARADERDRMVREQIESRGVARRSRSPTSWRR